MSYVIVGLAALIASSITLLAGFGLGTLLLPVFALFFPVAVAVSATAIVHAANNLFKLALLHAHADRHIVLRFGVPAVIAAFGGAFLLSVLSGKAPLFTWHLGEREAVVTPVKLVMGTLISVFALFDLVPVLRRLRIDPRWLPLGGVLSGFFGGLSGHQGALRAAFLGRLELQPAAFAATQAVIAVLVDAARIVIYGVAFLRGRMAAVETRGEWMLVALATACAFVGALIGRRLLPHVTVRGLRLLTGVLLFAVALGLGSGLV